MTPTDKMAYSCLQEHTKLNEELHGNNVLLVEPLVRIWEDIENINNRLTYLEKKQVVYNDTARSPRNRGEDK